MNVIIVRGSAIDSAVYKLAECLSKKGHDVELLIWNRKNTPVPGNTGYRIHNFSFTAPQNSAWVFLYFPIWWIYEFIYLINSDAEIIHACDLDTLYPAIIAKILKRKKFVYTIYDFYANHLPQIPHFSFIRQIIWSLVSTTEKFGIRYSDILMLVDESRFEEIQGASIKNLIYVYNSPPDILDKNVQKPGNAENVPLSIFYTGPVNKTRGIQYMAQAIEDLDGVKMNIGGIIDNQQFFDDMVKSNNRVNYLGWIPTYHEVLQKTMESDIIFRFGDPDYPGTKYASPNKLFEAMMCGKPIIVSDSGSMAAIVRKYHCGLVVPYGDIAAVRDAVVQLKNNPELRNELGKNGRIAYEQKFSWDLMEKILISAYDKIRI
jgi:glycosyltransferase involved in cell wall biosynthesis